MSELTHRWMKSTEKPEKKKEKEDGPGEQRAYKKLLAEAEEHGATLANEGKGGLPSSLVLGVFRRDEYRCKRCGLRENLSLHHKGGIVKSKWLSKKGHSNDPNNIAVICDKCHDDIHEEAREDGDDSSQVKPEGDKQSDQR